MTKIENFGDIERALARYVPLAAHITGKNITLDRMRPLMELFGDPQKRLKIIHIAGTSGKTSTAYFMAGLLSKSGFKTGLTVSPHVDNVAERIQINLAPLEEKEFAESLEEFLRILESSDIEPTYFELLVAFAYWYFEKIGVDYAVIETGMGGLQDGTNIASNSDKLCVITDIGLDHMHVLGHTVTEIAKQKAGIIHPRNIVFMYEQSEEIMRVFKDWCSQQPADFRIAEPFIDEKINQVDVPEFQKRNWALAYQTYQWLAERDALPTLDNQQLTETLHIAVPGRMDEVKLDGKKIIMDGAHNEQKMQAFVKSFLQQNPGIQVPVLLSLKEGKEFAAVLPLLKPIASTLVITEFEGGQDIPTHAIDAHELAAAAHKFNFVNVIIERDNEKAYQKLLEQDEDTVIITGSFYLLGQLRNRHKELIRG